MSAATRPPADSKLVHLCLLRARTAEGIAQEFGAAADDVLDALERLVRDGRLRHVKPGRVTAYRSVRQGVGRRSMDQRVRAAGDRMADAVARVGLRERVRTALAAEALPVCELRDRVGSDVDVALAALLDAGEIHAGDDDRYRRTPLPAYRRATQRRLHPGLANRMGAA